MRVRQPLPALLPALILVLCVAVMPPARAQPAPLAPTLQADLHAKLEAEIDRVADHLDGVLSYAIKDLSTGESFYRNADLVFPTASSIKLTVLLELMRQDQEGKLSLGEKHTVRHSELPPGDTDPILHMLGDGTVTMTLRDVATFMVVLSDNGATNILIDRAGMDNINAEIARLGLTQTHLRRRMIAIEAARRGDENLTTPRELMALLEKVRGGGVLGATHNTSPVDVLCLRRARIDNTALPSSV